MNYMKYLVTAATFYLFLTGCSSIKDTVSDNPPSKIYTSAHQKLQHGNYKDAIKELEVLKESYPFGPYAQQVQLDLIYAYYKSADLPLAQVIIDRFLRLNPTHPNVDYVLYMRGVTDMELDERVLQGFFGIDRFYCDPEHTRAAFRDFKKLISYYPNSQYSMDAINRLIYLKNQLARHELSVVEHYNKRGAYIAVANRVEQMLRDFPDTQATRQALFYMEKAYRELQLIGQADKVLKIRAMNPD